MIKQKSYQQLIEEIGVSYLGGDINNAKTKKSFEKGTLTYMVYLAPYKMSGYNVCPNAEFCHELCLNASGRNRGDIEHRGVEHSKINVSRIKKTKAFFTNKETFMLVLIHEINKYQNKAKRLNMNFAVRLNGTSDISPLAYHHKNVCNDKNILEIFPNVQFYDYTKVYSRTLLLGQYRNYDITFSYDGHNWDKCEKFIKNNGRVAVVFDKILPKKYRGYKVINGNTSDIRFEDESKVVIGLIYHRVATNYKNGKYIGFGNTDFVVKIHDENSIFRI